MEQINFSRAFKLVAVLCLVAGCAGGALVLVAAWWLANH